MNLHRMIRSLLTAALIAVLALPGTAQVFTGTFLSPRQARDAGVTVSDTHAAGKAVEVMVRRPFGGFDLGLRGGLMDGGDGGFTFGGEYRNPVLLGYFPLDLAVTTSAQYLTGDHRAFGGSVGMSIGHTVVPGNFTLTPFAHPRVAVVDRPGRAVAAELLAEAGIELELAGRFAFLGLFAIDEIGARWGLAAALR